MNELEQILKEKNLLDTIKKIEGKFILGNNKKRFTPTEFKLQVFAVFNISISTKEAIQFLTKWAKENRVTEKDIRDKLAKEVKGNIEIKTPAGFIDIMTEEEIIEVKEANRWKNAVGQILSYGSYYPDKTKRIHLFGYIAKGSFDAALSICKENSIKLTYESLLS